LFLLYGAFISVHTRLEFFGIRFTMYLYRHLVHFRKYVFLQQIDKEQYNKTIILIFSLHAYKTQMF